MAPLDIGRDEAALPAPPVGRTGEHYRRQKQPEKQVSCMTVAVTRCKASPSRAQDGLKSGDIGTGSIAGPAQAGPRASGRGG
jgi:hypothetical protein